MHPRGAQSTQSDQAFTLAEVMMATAVTLVAVVGLIMAVTMGSEMLDIARKQTVAMQIMGNEIESIHLRDWTTASALLVPGNYSITVNSNGTGFSLGSATDKKAFALSNSTSLATPPFVDNSNLISSAKGFTCSLTVTLVRTNLLQFTYTVTWIGGNLRKTYSRTSTTYYGKTGLNLYYQR